MTQQDRSSAKTDVVFVTSAPVPAGEVRLHAEWGDKVLVRSLDAIQEDWALVTEQVMTVISQTAAKPGSSGFGLDEVTIGLAFTAKGKLAFIAEAGAEATVTLTFKRSRSS